MQASGVPNQSPHIDATPPGPPARKSAGSCLGPPRLAQVDHAARSVLGAELSVAGVPPAHRSGAWCSPTRGGAHLAHHVEHARRLALAPCGTGWTCAMAGLRGSVWHRDRDSEGREKENMLYGGMFLRVSKVLSGRARQGERERERARGSEDRERRRATRPQNYHHVLSNLVIKAVVFPTATAPTARTVVVVDFYKLHPRLPTACARRKADQQTRKHREGQQRPFVGTGALYLSWRATISSCSHAAEH